MAREMYRLLLLFVLLLVVVSVCDARKKKHKKVKVRPLTTWTKWRCVSGGLRFERTRKLKARVSCPGHRGICHKIQHQYKAAIGKCGKCAVDMRGAFITSTTNAVFETTFSLPAGFVADGSATIADNVYVLCHNTAVGPPYQYQVNVYNANTNYSLTQTFSTPSGGNLLGLTACESKGYLYFTDMQNNVTYGMVAQTGVVNWQSQHTPFFYNNAEYYYDDITEDPGCNIAVTTLGPIIWGFTKDGTVAVNLTNAGVSYSRSVAQELGCFVVSYVNTEDLSLVSLFNAFGNIVANNTGVAFNFPTSVITNGGFVLVADNGDLKVALLNSQMVFQKYLVTGIPLQSHMWLDVSKRHLYLASRTDGSVVVYSLTG